MARRNRSSQVKREREQKKRERQRRKAEKAEQKRERRFAGEGEDVVDLADPDREPVDQPAEEATEPETP